jgi:hypothetical protein
MEMTAERFREEAVRRRGARRRGAAPYSDEQKAYAAAYARAGLSRGQSLMASAAALGVSEPTLRTWVQNVSTDARVPLRRVVVTPSTEGPATKLPRSATKLSGSSRLTLVTPTGYRLRGLDVASAAALLRVLG